MHTLFSAVLRTNLRLPSGANKQFTICLVLKLRYFTLLFCGRCQTQLAMSSFRQKVVGVDNPTTSFEVELSTSTKSKVPKKILHFSDGILEEYSSDDSDDSEDIVVKVDPSSLTWGPWCLYYMSGAARRTLSAADYCGERLAWLLGITTPKYQYAINEHNRIQKEIEMERIKNMKLKEETDGISSIDIKIVEGRKTRESVALTERSSKDDAEKY